MKGVFLRDGRPKDLNGYWMKWKESASQSFENFQIFGGFRTKYPGTTYSFRTINPEMQKCYFCDSHIINDWFTALVVQEKLLCSIIICPHCFGQPSIYSTLRENQRNQRDVCAFPNCLEYRVHDTAIGGFFCRTHARGTSEEEDRFCKVCSYCIQHDDVDICDYCMRTKATQDFAHYRSMGTIEQLREDSKQLQNFQSLGTYEELANLVSRRDILEHCDELNI